MICRLIKNEIKNLSLFTIIGQSFIKIDHILEFIIEPKDNSIIYGSKPFFEIFIGGSTYRFENSGNLKYTRILEYSQEESLELSFIYKSGSKEITVTKTFKVPFYLNSKIRMSNNNNFLSILKSVGDQIESYTKDEICGVLESLINHK